MLFNAIFEDMTHASDGMGREYTTENSLGIFRSLESAKKVCEKHYNGKIKWQKDPYHKGSILYSGDLGWAMYRIEKVLVKA